MELGTTYVRVVQSLFMILHLKMPRKSMLQMLSFIIDANMPMDLIFTHDYLEQWTCTQLHFQ